MNILVYIGFGVLGFFFIIVGILALVGLCATIFDIVKGNSLSTGQLEILSNENTFDPVADARDDQDEYRYELRNREHYNLH
jgi:hypothetical protein